jgi:hypothetical protein
VTTSASRWHCQCAIDARQQRCADVTVYAARAPAGRASLSVCQCAPARFAVPAGQFACMGGATARCRCDCLREPRARAEVLRPVTCVVIRRASSFWFSDYPGHRNDSKNMEKIVERAVMQQANVPINLAKGISKNVQESGRQFLHCADRAHTRRLY